jgi:hypothetical protein
MGGVGDRVASHASYLACLTLNSVCSLVKRKVKVKVKVKVTIGIKNDLIIEMKLDTD